MFLAAFVFMFYWDNKKEKTKPMNSSLREKTESEKELEKQIAIEKEKSRRGFGGLN